MWLLLSALTAQANRPAVTAAIYPEVFSLITDAIAGQQIDLQYDDLSASLSCFDAVGVRNLNLAVPIADVAITPTDGMVTVRVELDTVRGEDWTIYAKADRGQSLCTDFTGTLQWLELREGGIEMSFLIAASNGTVDLSLADTPHFFGDLDMDIEWAPSWADGWGWDLFPDDLILDLFESDAIELVGEKAGEFISAALADGISGASFATSIGDLDLGVTLDGLVASDEGIAADAVLDLGWSGLNACQPDAVGTAVQGAQPTIHLSGQGDEVLGFGLTERFLNEALYSLWEDGFFCLTPGDIDALLVDLLPGLDGDVSSLSAMITLDAPPVLTLDSGRVGLTLQDAGLQIIGRYQSERVTVLDTDLDADVLLSVDLDAALSSITVTLDALDLDLDVHETNHLLTDEPDATANFEEFMEGWLPLLAEERVVDLPVLGVAGISGDHAGRLTRLHIDRGALTGGFALYSAADPVVDTTAPEGDVALVEATEDGVVIEMLGEDDREAPLAFRYRVDHGAWSSWSLDDEAEIALDLASEHVIEVVARDSWLNEDPRAARLRVGPDDLTPSSAVEGGCAHTPALGGWLLALLAVGWRREE